MNPIFEDKALDRALRSLEIDLEDTDRSHIVLASSPNAALLRETRAEMARRLHGQYDQRSFDYTAPHDSLSLGRFCRNVKREELPICVHAFGLDALREKNGENFEDAVTLLNNHREDIVYTKSSVILWVQSDTLIEVYRKAPDFADWRTSTAEFRPPDNTYVRPTALGRLPIERSELLRRDVRRYRKTLASPAISRPLRAEHLLRLSECLHQLGEEQEANGFREEATRLYAELEDFRALETLYLDRLIAETQYIDPRGIMQTERSVALKLDEVYVSLTAERRRGWAADRMVFDSHELEAEPDEESPPAAGDAEEARSGRFRRPAEPIAERVDLAKAVRDNARMVLLGDPGAGKTTLLKFLALIYAQARKDAYPRYSEPVKDGEGREYGEARLPILARISRYAEALNKNPELLLRDFLLTSQGEDDAECAANGALFRRALDQEQAFVLLDGMDEIVDADTRGLVAQNIEQFVRDLKGNRCIVTSRIAGYRASPLNDTFVELTLRDLGDVEIARFLRKWCPAFERYRRPDGDPALLEKTSQQEVAAIEAALKQNPGVRRLAANPLLLTILCLIHRNGKRLPARRAELYTLAAQTLLRDWQHARDVPEVLTVSEEEQQTLLEPLAYWLHEEHSSGLASEAEVKIKLCEWLSACDPEEDDIYVTLLPTAPPPDRAEIEEKASDFLRRVREFTGLFVERAPGYFGFMHLTFEEYFAARYILSDSRKSAQRIREHLHDPRWEEPILLAIGMASRQDASYLILTAILGRNPKESAFARTPEEQEIENILHRDLLFAAKCVGDAVGVEPPLLGFLSQALFEIVLFAEQKKLNSLQARLRSVFTHVQGSDLARELANHLLKALRDEDELISETAALVLGQSRMMADAEIFLLLQALKDEQWFVRRNVIFVLSQVCDDTEEVVSAMLHALKDESWPVRKSAISALGRQRLASEEVVSAIFQALKDESWSVRQTAATALGRLKVISEEVVSALLQALKPDEAWSVRRNAVWALGRLGVWSEAVVSALLQSLTDVNKHVRQNAVTALGQSGLRSEAIISALLQALKDESWQVRETAALALGRNGSENSIVVLALFAATEDRDLDVRQTSASVLGRLGARSQKIVATLLQALKDNDKCIRRSAALVLGHLGEGSGVVLPALINALKDEEWSVRRNVALAIGQLGESSEEVVSALLQALKPDEAWSVRRNAVWALGRLGVWSEAVVSALLQSLTDVNKHVRQNAVTALGQSGLRSEAIISALLQALKDESWQVRLNASSVLGQFRLGSVEVIESLIHALKDDNAIVREKVASVLGHIVGGGRVRLSTSKRNHVRTALLDLLPCEAGVYTADSSASWEALWKVCEAESRIGKWSA